jgi:hypothetical protein
MNNKYVLTDESGILSISQGEAMVYDDLSFMTKAVAEKAVRLLNEGKGRTARILEVGCAFLWPVFFLIHALEL